MCVYVRVCVQGLEWFASQEPDCDVARIQVSFSPPSRVVVFMSPVLCALVRKRGGRDGKVVVVGGGSE